MSLLCVVLYPPQAPQPGAPCWGYSDSALPQPQAGDQFWQLMQNERDDQVWDRCSCVAVCRRCCFPAVCH